MENIVTSKKTVFLFLSVGLAAILIVLALTLWYRNALDRKVGNNSQTQANTPEQVLKVDKKEVDKDKSPDKFPADVPVESGAKITQNYNASTADGRFQATRVFETNKSLAENYKIYSDYMKASGWKIAATIDQEGYKMISGSKGNVQLQISINENTLLKTKNVSISLTELPNTPSK